MIKPAENPDVAKAMNAQQERLVRDREIFLRMLTVMADALVNQKELMVEKGLILIPDEVFAAAPHKHQVEVVRMTKPEDAPADAPEVMWGIRVVPKAGVNGTLVAPERPGLVLP